MHPLIPALGEPWAWRKARRPLLHRLFPWTRKALAQETLARVLSVDTGGHAKVEMWIPTLVLQHRSGSLIHVEAVRDSWIVRDPRRSMWGDTFVRFRRTGSRPRVKDFRRDLDAVFGPEARAKLDRVIGQVRRECVQKGLTGHVTLLRDVTYGPASIRLTGDVSDNQSYGTLSSEVRKAILECRGILHPTQDGSTLAAHTLVALDLPQSAHERLAFFQSMQHTGVHIDAQRD